MRYKKIAPEENLEGDICQSIILDYLFSRVQILTRFQEGSVNMLPIP